MAERLRIYFAYHADVAGITSSRGHLRPYNLYANGISVVGERLSDSLLYISR